jgi:hypothetical protein
MRHSDFQEWADLNLGDTRQVYARDKRRPPDAALVYMRDGEADRFREDARAGHLVCPVPGCPAPKLTTKHGETRRDHFAHMPSAGALKHENYGEIVVGQLLRHWVLNQAPDVELIEQESEPGSPITILTRLRDGDELAICYVKGRLGLDSWIGHRRDLEDEGIASAWIFAPSERYLSLPEPQTGSPPENHEDDEGEFASLLIRDTPLFEMMRRCGCWPLLINMERQELANLLVPGYATAERLGLRSAYAEGVLHAVTSPLDTCRICEDGIECKPIVYAGSLKKIRQGGQQRLWEEERKLRGHSPRPRQQTKQRFVTHTSTDTPDTPVPLPPSRIPTPPKPHERPDPSESPQQSRSPQLHSPPQQSQPTQPPAEPSLQRPPYVPPPTATESPFTPRQSPPPPTPTGTRKGSSRGRLVALGICIVAAAIIIYPIARTLSVSKLSALQKQEHSLLTEASDAYSNCSKGKSSPRFFAVTCYINPSEAEEQEIIYVKLRPIATIAALAPVYDAALKSHKMGYCSSLGSAGWRMSNSPDQGEVECGQEGLLWCDRPARLFGAIYIMTEESAQVSEQAALAQLPHVVNVLNPGQPSDFELDAHATKC